MIVQPYGDSRRITIAPGELYVGNQQEVISTLLGSCVAACLYDATKGIIGMNHFLLAKNHDQAVQSIIESDAGRYGLYAMELLINQMMSLGASKQNLQAKCFGGGNVLNLNIDEEYGTIGDNNVKFIREFLKNENIPIISSCLGGNHGRLLHFTGKDYSVFVKKIAQNQEQLVVNEERKFLLERINDVKKPNKPEIW